MVRISAVSMVFVLAAGLIFLIIPVGVMLYAETMPACSGKYASDLERKHLLLNSIKEDVEQLEIGLKRSIRKPENMEKPKELKLEGLKISGEDLAKIMPPTPKINLQVQQMSGTLSPVPRGKKITSH